MNRTVRPISFAFEPDMVSVFAKMSFDEDGAPVLDTRYSKGICNVASTVITATGDTNTSTIITNVSSFAGLYVGMTLTGTDIPAGTTIVSMDASTGEIELSQAATGSTVGVTLSVSGGRITITFGSQFTPFKRLDTYVRLLQLTALWDTTELQGDGSTLAMAPAATQVVLVDNSISISGEASLTLQLVAMVVSGGGSESAPANPRLGADLQTLAVLGSTAVTNTGSSVIGGDVGIDPAGAITGFPPGLITGATHNGDATSLAARTQLAAALVALNALTTTETFAPATVIGTGGTRPILGPGVYEWATAGQLTGALTLNAGGDPNAEFVFLMGSTLTTAAASSIILAGGAQADNVYWVMGSSATLGTGTQLEGNVLAQTSITLVTGSTVTGRLLAHDGAVTLDSNSVTTSAQAAPESGPVVSGIQAVNPSEGEILRLGIHLTRSTAI